MSKMNFCKHEFEEKEYIVGKGYVGVCKKCGTKLVRSIRKNVEPRERPHMSKKERLKARHEVSSS